MGYSNGSVLLCDATHPILSYICYIEGEANGVWKFGGTIKPAAQQQQDQETEDIQHGPLPVEQLRTSGIVKIDVKKLEDAGICIVESVAYTPRKEQFKSNSRKSDSACIIFPPKVFRLLEKPLHEFHSHEGEVLDVSWSKHNYLLSSSVDKTVRLWQVGHECCLKVFSHSNCVTCIQFNPVDDNYFISGSIDGRVSI